MVDSLEQRVRKPLSGWNSGGEEQVPQAPWGGSYGDWKPRFALAGKIWRAQVGGMTAGGDELLITGGGAGTTIDQDQPELAVSVPEGQVLVPVRIKVGAQVDLIADADVGSIIATVDRATALAAATSTTEVPVNLNGQIATPCPATVLSAITADIADPVETEILDYVTARSVVLSSVGNQAILVAMDYKPDYPEFILGPCTMYVYWGGTQAVPGIATVDFAVLEVADLG